MTAPAFKIGDDLYPIPTKFLLPDAVLVKQLTDLEFDDFAGRCDATQKDGARPDVLVMVGLIGIAVQRVHPEWSRAQVGDFLAMVDMESIGAEKGDVLPPAEAPETGKDLQSLSGESIPTPEPEPVPDPV